MHRRMVMVGLVLAGCAPDAAPTDVSSDAPAYTAPPVADSVAVAAPGQLTVSGRAGPDERVRVIQMDGTAHGGTADANGTFSIAMPAGSGTDLLFNLSVERAGQSVSSDGWLFSPANVPSRSVMLRIGGASLPVGPAPLLAVVDMDAGGGVALAGRSTPGARVRVSLDGQDRGAAQADESGLWFTVLSSTVSAGPHQITVNDGGDRVDRRVDLQPQRASGPLEVAHLEDAVRIAWVLPGGGNQTTWILLP
ncbi:MAG TPA: hypothetical protein PLE81_01245 [Brevundimonas sp.]|uniref:hypothetical protein n=1 Tax=Brevundimonas sp. TaxID=1871086 RepID=UPI002C1BE12D|nr:hypothetical protein [Brevundimonas sp.]HRH19243.1 hypothetical protein [Brevundimonas sp.]